METHRMVIITATVGLFLLGYFVIMPRMIYGPQGKPSPQKDPESMGEFLDEMRVSGWIGRVYFKNRGLLLRVYQDAIMIKPFLMAPGVILRSEMISVREEKIFLYNVIRIDHRSGDVRSPVKISMVFGSEKLNFLLTHFSNDYQLPDNIF